MSGRDAERRARMNATEPAVMPGQGWICRNENGAVIRALRVVAPDTRADLAGGGRRWFVQDSPSQMVKRPGPPTSCPEMSLRYVFDLDESEGMWQANDIYLGYARWLVREVERAATADPDLLDDFRAALAGAEEATGA